MIVLAIDKITEQMPVLEQLMCIHKVVGSAGDAIGTAGITGNLVAHKKSTLEQFEYGLNRMRPARSPPWVHPELKIAEDENAKESQGSQTGPM